MTKKIRLEIKHFSKEDRRQYKEKFPLFEPELSDWAVIDSETDAVIDSFDTEGEAQAVLDDLNESFMIEGNFRDWVRETAQKLGIEEQKILDAVQVYL